MSIEGNNNETLINYEMLINVIVDTPKFNGLISHRGWSLWQRKLLSSWQMGSKEEKEEAVVPIFLSRAHT